MEVILNQENFETEVLKSEIPVLVDFWADWCMPCHAIAPAVTELAKTYDGRLKVGKLNVDEHPELAAAYQVRSIPNLKIFKNAKIVGELVGALPKSEIRKRVEKYL